MALIFDPEGEQALRDVRRMLNMAHQLEVQGLCRAADAVGATAANRLAGAVYRGSKVLPLGQRPQASAPRPAPLGQRP